MHLGGKVANGVKKSQLHEILHTLAASLDESSIGYAQQIESANVGYLTHILLID